MVARNLFDAVAKRNQANRRDRLPQLIRRRLKKALLLILITMITTMTRTRPPSGVAQTVLNPGSLLILHRVAGRIKTPWRPSVGLCSRAQFETRNTGISQQVEKTVLNP